MGVWIESVTFPREQPPSGAEGVDRWYQLDPAAMTMVELAAKLKGRIKLPSAIVLTASAGSLETDFAFASGGFASPQKFVHTLPSVRLAPFCQVLNWRGPAICLQQGEQTFAQGLRVASQLLDRWPRPWLIGLKRETAESIGVFLIEVDSLAVVDRNEWQQLKNAEFWTKVRP